MEKFPASARPRIDLSDPEAFRRNPKLITDIKASDFVLVHKTNRLPDKNGIIYPSVFSHPEEARATVHFSLNGPVNEHVRGNAWDSCKYAIIIPFERLDEDTKRRVVSFNPSDTYVLGPVKLPEGSLIIGKEEHLRDKSRFGKSDVKIIPRGDNVNEHVFSHIAGMGRCPMQINDKTWLAWNEYSHRGILYRIADNLGLPRYELHYDSMLHGIEERVRSMNLSKDSDFAVHTKPSAILDAYRKEHVDSLEELLHPSEKELKWYRETYDSKAESVRDARIRIARDRLAEFDRIRPGLEASWKRGLAEKRAKELPSRLEKSHYNKMHGKGESW